MIKQRFEVKILTVFGCANFGVHRPGATEKYSQHFSGPSTITSHKRAENSGFFFKFYDFLRVARIILKSDTKLIVFPSF